MLFSELYRRKFLRVTVRLLQFMGITYVLEIAWLLMLCFLVIVTLLFTIFWGLCNDKDVQSNRKCIDFRQFCK